MPGSTPQTVSPGVMNYRGEGAPTGGTNEVQTATIGGSPTGGTWSLTYTENGLSSTASGLAHNISAANLATALNALETIQAAGGVTVSGTAPYSITFLAGRNVPALVAEDALTGGSSPDVTIATTTPGVLGTFGGKAPKGAQYTDMTNGKVYINTGTQNTPVWTVVGAQS